MGAMAYLIMTTTPVVNKIWNPYDILGISEVSRQPPPTARDPRFISANQYNL